MIWAIETYEQHGRPTCSECPPQWQKKRGCPLPGQEQEQAGPPFRYTSPALHGTEHAILKTCPVGKIRMDHPWVYDVIDAVGYSEHTSIRDYRKLPRFMHHAIRLVRSERERCRELKRELDQGFRDSAHGQRAARR